VLFVGIVTAEEGTSEADRSAAYVSRFEQAALAPVTSAPVVTQHSGHVAAHLQLTTGTSTDSANDRVIPSLLLGGRADVSDLLFDDDQLLPGLPPPLIPIPDIYQPHIDVDPATESAGAKTMVPSNEHPDSMVHKNFQSVSPSKTGECSVCMECEPNAALYPCGHMCMCYNCAMSVTKLRGALCPICRQPIIDILRIYRT